MQLRELARLNDMEMALTKAASVRKHKAVVKFAQYYTGNPGLDLAFQGAQHYFQPGFGQSPSGGQGANAIQAYKGLRGGGGPSEFTGGVPNAPTLPQPDIISQGLSWAGKAIPPLWGGKPINTTAVPRFSDANNPFAINKAFVRGPEMEARLMATQGKVNEFLAGMMRNSLTPAVRTFLKQQHGLSDQMLDDAVKRIGANIGGGMQVYNFMRGLGIPLPRLSERADAMGYQFTTYDKPMYNKNTVINRTP